MVRKTFGTVAITSALSLIAASAASAVAHRAPPPAVQGMRVSSAAGCPGGTKADYVAATDPYSLFSQIRDMGADAFYGGNDFGQGIDVAMIDTGVAPVQAIDAGNVIDGPDLSFDSQANYGDHPNSDLPHDDGFGHGTHIAGIIAGRDNPVAPYSVDDSTKFSGVAPGARVVSMKVGDGGGAVDVSQVIAAVDWIVQHRNDYGLHIRVLNLSYGVDTHDTAADDALSHAVTEAWHAGIVVVAAAGNGGHGAEVTTRGGLLAPAFTPTVLAVGAYDNAGTTTGANAHDDDVSADFSSSGGTRHPDVVAPGAHVLSLHAVGSDVDNMIFDDCTNAKPTDARPWYASVFGPGGRFVRGSGTSQATAMVSGVVALLLSKNPSLSPDQVKQMLRDTARRMSQQQQHVNGRGEIDAASLYSATVPVGTPSTFHADGGKGLDYERDDQSLPCTTDRSVRNLSNGACSAVWNYFHQFGGSAYHKLLQSDVHSQYFDSVTHACDEQIDPQTQDYVAASTLCPRAPSYTRRRPWTDQPDGQRWNGSRWTGLGWEWSALLQRVVWKTAPWDGNDFELHPWSAHVFNGNHWVGNQWRGDDMQGNQWRVDGMQGNQWRDDDWLGTRWVGNQWRDSGAY